MARRPARLHWLTRVAIDAIHGDQIREHGGLPALRDENALESALARPQQEHHYEGTTDIARLAAAYGFGLIRNHPCHDGNKRIGFLAIVTFLGMNGYELEATDAEVVTEILSVAGGGISEETLAGWIRKHSVKRRRV